MSDLERLRLVILGGQGVGKSCIIKRFLFKTYSDKYRATIEDLYNREYFFGNTTLKVNIIGVFLLIFVLTVIKAVSPKKQPPPPYPSILSISWSVLGYPTWLTIWIELQTIYVIFGTLWGIFFSDDMILYLHIDDSSISIYRCFLCLSAIRRNWDQF